MQPGVNICRVPHLISGTVYADEVEPEILAHMLNTESCGLKAWLLAVPADSHPEVLTACVCIHIASVILDLSLRMVVDVDCSR